MANRLDSLLGSRVQSLPLSRGRGFPVLLDGGMGTALSGRGLDTRSDSTAAWNHTHPDVVAAVHQAFVEAGADAIHTNSFAANPWQLGTDLDSDAFIRANKRAAEIALESAGGSLVIGDIGPSGALPPPEGDADLNVLEEVFAVQAAVLAEAGVDFLHVETLYHPKEARAAVRGCRVGAPDLPVVASMACRRGSTGVVTVAGLPWRGVLRAALEEGADGVGVNCSMTPREMRPLIEALIREVGDRPVFAQPTIAPDGGPPLYPGEFAAGLLDLVAVGARAVGGCCGTSPHDIASARLSLDALPEPTRGPGTAPFERRAQALT